jgi:hypothetical protein
LKNARSAKGNKADWISQLRDHEKRKTTAKRLAGTVHCSIEVVENGIQSHFLLAFGELSLIIHEYFSGPVVPLFDFFLSSPEQFHPPLRPPQLANLPVPIGSSHPVGRIEQLVIVGEKLANRAGVTLAGAPTKQLQVDSSRLVQLRPNHMQAPELANVLADLNVGSAASHIRCNRDFAVLAGFSNNFRLAFHMVGVQH